VVALRARFAVDVVLAALSSEHIQHLLRVFIARLLHIN
jgi:hypothetical protein